MQDTNTGDTVVGDGGRKNGTLLSPANIVLLSFHIVKSVNIRREDAIVLESYIRNIAKGTTDPGVECFDQ